MSVVKRRPILFGGAGLALLLALLAAVAVVATGAIPGNAQVSSTSTTAVNQYAAKFLCGQIPSPASPAKILAPGVYNTAVNIHNPNTFPVTIQKKAVLSEIEPNQGLPGQRQTHVLEPDASMEVDCTEIFNLLASANPPCGPGGAVFFFCKGYLVVEAAQLQTIAGQVRYFAAQLDVTDIISVKEEDGIWKDYTFQVRCDTGVCPQITPVGPNFGYLTDLNWPDRPPVPPCYGVIHNPCDIYDVEDLIRKRLDLHTGTNFFTTNLAATQITVRFVSFATDSRDVALDYEFVSPKRATYPCWPKGTATCP